MYERNSQSADQTHTPTVRDHSNRPFYLILAVDDDRILPDALCFRPTVGQIKKAYPEVYERAQHDYDHVVIVQVRFVSP
jgi:hypothetical protein